MGAFINFADSRSIQVFKLTGPGASPDIIIFEK